MPDQETTKFICEKILNKWVMLFNNIKDMKEGKRKNMKELVQMKGSYTAMTT